MWRYGWGRRETEGNVDISDMRYVDCAACALDKQQDILPVSYVRVFASEYTHGYQS